MHLFILKQHAVKSLVNEYLIKEYLDSSRLSSGEVIAAATPETSSKSRVRMSFLFVILPPNRHVLR